MQQDNHLDFYVYIGVVTDEFTPDLRGEAEDGTDENVDYGWFTLDEIPDNSMPIVKEIVESNRDVIEGVVGTLVGRI